MFSQRFHRGLALIGLAAVLAACSSSKPPLPTLSPVAESAEAKLLWKTSLGSGGVLFVPVVAGESVFAASPNGTVAKLNIANGSKEWQQNLGTRLSSGVAVDGDLLVVVSRDGVVLALDGQGKRRWESALGSDVAAVPAIANGVVLVRGTDNRVHGLDGETGKRRWVFQRQASSLTLRQASGIAVTQGVAFVGLPGARLVAISVTDGAPVWEQLVSISRGTNDVERVSDIVGSPVLMGRSLCAVAFQGRIACFDAANGQPRWSAEFSSGSGLEIDSRALVSAASDGTVTSFDRDDGKPRWKQTKLERRTLGAPFATASGYLLGDQQGLVHMLDRADGALAGRSSTDGTPIIAAPVGNRNYAVVQTLGGSLVGFGLQ